MIRNLLKSLCCVLIFFTALNSCEKIFSVKGFSEVDFSNKVLVQMSFYDNVYNGTIYLENGELNIEFKGNNGFPDGLKYTISNEFCCVYFMGMTKKTSIEKIEKGSIPLVLFDFIDGFGGVVTTENYNSKKDCTYITRDISDKTVTLEVYENKESYGYSFIVK